MIRIYVVHEQYIDDDSSVASFNSEADANQCAEYLNNFNRTYKHYYVEEECLYGSFADYLVDVKSN